MNTPTNPEEKRMTFENPEDVINRQLADVRVLIRVAESMELGSTERAGLCSTITAIQDSIEESQRVLLASRGVMLFPGMH